MTNNNRKRRQAKKPKPSVEPVEQFSRPVEPAPTPVEPAAAPIEPTPQASHHWDASGERCEVCGDKDWMGGGCSGPREEPVAQTVKKPFSLNPWRLLFGTQEDFTPWRVVLGTALVMGALLYGSYWISQHWG